MQAKVIGIPVIEPIKYDMLTFKIVVLKALAISLLAGEKHNDVDPIQSKQLTYRKRSGHRRQLVENYVGPGNSNSSFSY